MSRFDMGVCLECGKPMTAALRLRDHDQPEPGSIMVCIYCSHVMEWDGSRLIPLTDEAIREIAGDPEFLETVAFTNFYQREARE